jgi:hypothetical protein
LLASTPPHNQRKESAGRWSGKDGAQLRWRGCDRRGCTGDDVSWLKTWNSFSPPALETCAGSRLAHEGHRLGVTVDVRCAEGQPCGRRFPGTNERDVDPVVSVTLSHIQQESSGVADRLIAHHREDVSGLQHGRRRTVGIHLRDDHSASCAGRKGEFRSEALHRNAHIGDVFLPARGETRRRIEQIACADNRWGASVHDRRAKELTIESEQERTW